MASRPQEHNQLGERNKVMKNKLLLTVGEAATALGMGRSKVYELVRDGVIPSVKIDGCRRVKVAALAAYVDALPEVA